MDYAGVASVCLEYKLTPLPEETLGNHWRLIDGGATIQLLMAWLPFVLVYNIVPCVQ